MKRTFKGYSSHTIDTAELRNNMDIIQLSNDAKGFFFTYVVQVNWLCFPYGFCSVLCRSTAQIAEYLNIPKDTLSSMGAEELRNYLATECSISEQLGLVVSFEEELFRHLAYTQEQIASYIQQLEERGVFRRTVEGILYSPLLLEYLNKRVTAYFNGKKRGKPKLKQGRNNSAGAIATSEGLANTHPEVSADGPYRSSCPYCVREQSNAAVQIPHFDLKPYYIGGYEVARRRWRELSEGAYQNWRRFVTHIIEAPQYHGVLIAMMVEPPDFAAIVVTHKLTPVQWDMVISKVLERGLKPGNKLFFRIPDAIVALKRQ